MRITLVRRIWQGAFLFLFAYLAFYTAAGAARLALLGVSGSLFLETDPLIALGTLAATRQLYHVGVFGLLWALLVFMSALVFGRAFCSWVCPFGTVHHAIGWLGRPRTLEARAARNESTRAQSAKYVVLAAFMGAALLGSLQVGLLDPLALFHRSVAACLLPFVEACVRWATPDGTAWVYTGDVPLHAFGWVLGLVVLALFLANLAMPRFFCRVLCPLGALLGVVSRVSLFRIARNEAACTGCGRCRAHCEGACDPGGLFRRAECVTCFNCLDDCPHGALSYRFMPSEATEIPWPEVRARRVLLGALAGALFAPFVRLSGGTTRDFGHRSIRPPGAVEEHEFLARCVKCGQCVRVCPTNVLQPALFEAGVEGLWTPVLKMRFGACDKDCTLCGQVCPTGAIERLTAAQRNGLAPYPGRDERVLVSVGTAFFDRGRCLPWAMDVPCVVCQEVCPVSPKAIVSTEVIVTRPDGAKVRLQRPQVEPARCIGCGACEHACPVKDLPAVRVTPIGETRSGGYGGRDRGLLIGG